MRWSGSWSTLSCRTTRLTISTRVPPGGSDALFQGGLRPGGWRHVPEKLSRYLDIVELHLVKEISLRSNSFFEAQGQLEDLNVKIVEGCGRIRELKETILLLDLNETRSNLLALQQKLRLILYVNQALSALKLLVASADCAGAVHATSPLLAEAGGLQLAADGDIRMVDGDAGIHEVVLLQLSCLHRQARHQRLLLWYDQRETEQAAGETAIGGGRAHGGDGDDAAADNGVPAALHALRAQQALLHSFRLWCSSFSSTSTSTACS